ncbi:hypothetical protein BLNAU_16212 [Blattamonas nauphoetae]|uniref:Uncharacterized protein n=1 Tax=Blattamonas nauphoetae TaxID=2049346 RepID=A0ABQ9XBV2_9EUKA|nr:hypothetical protein BLNAU_16212 [Blattamonas nauphoetae]
MDCSPFRNWSVQEYPSESRRTVLFRSLVATVKLQPALDASLEAKAVQFLRSAIPFSTDSTDAFVSNLGRTTDESMTCFVQCVVVLISSTSQVVITAAMKMLNSLITNCSATYRLALIKADLIPQLIIILNPQSLSFEEAVDINFQLLSTITDSLWLATPFFLIQLQITDRDEQQAVQKTVLKQVLYPSEKYISHLCTHHFSFMDGDLSKRFLTLIARLLKISPYSQPTMDFVLNMPVVLTISSSLTFFEDDKTIYHFLYDMNDIQQEWNRTGGNRRQMWKTVHRMLRMEGIEDVIEERLRNDKSEYSSKFIVAYSIRWNNLLGRNLP